MQSKAIFVLCGTDFCRLEFSHKSNSLAIHRIWLTDRIRTAYQQTSIQAVTQIGPQRHLEDSGIIGSLICLSGTDLIMAALDDQDGPRIVLRRIPIGGTPTRIIFSRYLNKLVVGYLTLEMRPPQQVNGHGRSSGRRCLRPTIQVIDPDSDPIKIDPMNAVHHGRKQSESARATYPVGKPGERICGMLGTQVSLSPLSNGRPQMLTTGRMEPYRWKQNLPHASADYSCVSLVTAPSRRQNPILYPEDIR